ncbi:hypothetical protein DES40_1932 [Litorimonas taeanensis]|uniref:Uncharacterized protein n=1 Tax=Litorimonas taeanensis TaxID=568099 RepID=A0A420WDX3_9PROT|nr:hypothetical protein [Litorimonas taeanensis]RKQ69145.1 hypothetical protein DES40_1932 [Litorimonas taeanensis]
MPRLTFQKIIFASLTASLIFSGGINMGTEPHAHARQTSQINSLNDMLAWHQQYLQAYTQILSVYNTGSISILYSIDYEDLDAVKRAFSHYNAEREAILSRGTALFDQLAPPQQWDVDRTLFNRQDKAYYVAALQKYNDIPDLLVNIREGSNFLPAIELIEQGKYEAASQTFIEKQIEANQALIVAENKQIDAYLAAIPKDHPNYQIQQIFKKGNHFALKELEWSRRDMIEFQSLEQRHEFAKEMKQTIEEVPSLIQLSRNNTLKTLETLKIASQSQSARKSDQELIKRVTKALQTFDESLDVEQKIYANQQATVVAHQSNLIDNEYTAVIDKIDLEFFVLIDERTRLADKRLTLVQP